MTFGGDAPDARLPGGGALLLVGDQEAQASQSVPIGRAYERPGDLALRRRAQQLDLALGRRVLIRAHHAFPAAGILAASISASVPAIWCLNTS